MSGLVKAKEYKVEDSNVEGLGSKENKDLVKGTAVQHEPAWRRHKEYHSGTILNTSEAVKDSKGKPHHIEIWRIEKFKVKFWPREQHGQFFSGDSYLILHTYKNEEDKVGWNLHFWLGKDTTQDEMGTAAYKTVELDTVLDDGPVQHREVQEHESELFLKIFSDILKCGGIRYMDGGVDSGFRHVEPESYKPRLLHLKGKKKVRVSQVPIAVSSLNGGDLFILDLGLKIIVWTGGKAGMFEKNKGRETSDAIKTERKGKAQVINIREGDKTEEAVLFFKHLGGTPDDRIKTAEEGGDDDEETQIAKAGPQTTKLYRLSDASGSLKFTKEAEGSAIKRSLLDTNDVFVFDAGFQIFVWVGKGSTKQEKDEAIPNAVKYLKDNKRPDYLPITRELDGGESKPFLLALQA